MGNRRRLSRLIRAKLRSAGRQVEQARQQYNNGMESAKAGLPRDTNGRAKVVCRRYAEKRAVALDETLKPHCYDATSVDCQGCVEDIRKNVVETWD
jgi:ubiquitin